MKNQRVFQLYKELLNTYEPPEELWPQWCASEKTPALRELIAIGAILTQRTSWHNANLALKNLQKANLLSLTKISELSNSNCLTELIHPAGFFQTKPQRLFDLASLVVREYRGIENFRREELEVAREKLLAIKGIGPETADTILLYALDKPSFVVDEYTRRLVKERKLSTDLSYDGLKKLFEENLPQDVKIYQNFHTLIIRSQKDYEGSVMELIL